MESTQVFYYHFNLDKYKYFYRSGLLLLLILFSSCGKSDGPEAGSPDPNYYIYLCFGQSNMEGGAAIEAIDKNVDTRFRVMAALDCPNLGRKKGSWYNATPPLCTCSSGLSPADYFGRTMVANLPAKVKVGVINVSVSASKIELFDKDSYKAYVSTITEDWMKERIAAYGGNPYAYLVEMAKPAQKDGVIKVLNQMESIKINN
jgi:hypothetical protein